MGTPKQVLVYGDKTLLRHSVDEALSTGMQPVIVVLGADRLLLEKELENISCIQIVFNNNWQEGMASSIRSGVEATMKLEPRPDGLIIMVCDQPFISAGILKNLYKTQQETGKTIVASSYHNIPGVPALFHEGFFKDLLELKGDRGARKLLKDHTDLLALVNFPKGATDIDTMNDYLELKKLIRENQDDKGFL